MTSSLSKLESKFQGELKKDIQRMLPGSIIMKTDPSQIQGIPDLIILYNDRWAALECKRSSKAKHRPNQDYYIDLMNKMSFSSFIYPENKKEVLDALQQALRS